MREEGKMPKWHRVCVCAQIHAALTHGGLTEGDVLGGEALNLPILICVSDSFRSSLPCFLRLTHPAFGLFGPVASVGKS